jgi:two-component system, NarL family, response regulator DesR
MAPQNPLRVLIADDNGLFARALETLLTTEETISIVGMASDGEEAAQRAADLAPDVVLMDLSMPRVDGFEATRKIREAAPGTAVVVLTGSADQCDVERAGEAGAAGYVTKDRILKELVEAIHSAAHPDGH